MIDDGDAGTAAAEEDDEVEEEEEGEVVVASLGLSTSVLFLLLLREGVETVRLAEGVEAGDDDDDDEDEDEDDDDEDEDEVGVDGLDTDRVEAGRRISDSGCDCTMVPLGLLRGVNVDDVESALADEPGAAVSVVVVDKEGTGTLEVGVVGLNGTKAGAGGNTVRGDRTTETVEEEDEEEDDDDEVDGAVEGEDDVGKEAGAPTRPGVRIALDVGSGAGVYDTN